MIPRYTGVDADDVANTEADYFNNCPIGVAYLDMRDDLGQVLAHVHDLTIELCVGEDSLPREGPLQ